MWHGGHEIYLSQIFYLGNHNWLMTLAAVLWFHHLVYTKATLRSLWISVEDTRASSMRWRTPLTDDFGSSLISLISLTKTFLELLNHWRSFLLIFLGLSFTGVTSTLYGWPILFWSSYCLQIHLVTFQFSPTD